MYREFPSLRYTYECIDFVLDVLRCVRNIKFNMADRQTRLGPFDYFIPVVRQMVGYKLCQLTDYPAAMVKNNFYT